MDYHRMGTFAALILFAATVLCLLWPSGHMRRDDFRSRDTLRDVFKVCMAIKVILTDDTFEGVVMGDSITNVDPAAICKYIYIEETSSLGEVRQARWERNIRTRRILDGYGKDIHIEVKVIEVDRNDNLARIYVRSWSDGPNGINEEGKGDDIMAEPFEERIGLWRLKTLNAIP